MLKSVKYALFLALFSWNWNVLSFRSVVHRCHLKLAHAKESPSSGLYGGRGNEVQSLTQLTKAEVGRWLAVCTKTAGLLTASLVIKQKSKAEDADNSRAITHKVYIEIKIANYTEESVGRNFGAAGSGRVVLGLYGDRAPIATQLFLSLIRSNGSEYPSYVRSQFAKVSGEGVLQVEHVPGVNPVTIAGEEQQEYLGRILPFKPFMEASGLKHDRRGLLTRRQLSEGPEFGLTLRPCADLDAFHEVFGEVVEGFDVLDAIEQIPTYSMKTKSGYAGKEKGPESAIADSWFENQKKFYVAAGQAFGDKRAVDRSGKLLRRVKIIGAGEL